MNKKKIIGCIKKIDKFIDEYFKKLLCIGISGCLIMGIFLFNNKFKAPKKEYDPSIYEDFLNNGPDDYCGLNYKDVTQFLGSDSFNLYDTLEENENLNNDEKEIVDDFIDTIDEKLPMYNQKIFNKNLESLEIKQYPEFFRKYTLGKGTLATYEAKENIITGGTTTFNKEVAYHELLHSCNRYSSLFGSFSFTDYTEGVKYGEAFSEGMTELLTNELIDNNKKNFSYYHTVYSVYSLSMLISRDRLLDIYFYGSVHDLENELLSIINDEKKARETISYMDQYIECNDNLFLYKFYENIIDYNFANMKKNINEKKDYKDDIINFFHILGIMKITQIYVYEENGVSLIDIINKDLENKLLDIYGKEDNYKEIFEYYYYYQTIQNNKTFIYDYKFFKYTPNKKFVLK